MESAVIPGERAGEPNLLSLTSLAEEVGDEHNVYAGPQEYGNYSCVATNRLGTGTGSLLVTGGCSFPVLDAVPRES